MSHSAEIELRTARLMLRPATVSDAEAIARLANDPRIARMTARIPYPYRLEHATGWLAGLHDSNEHAFVAMHEADIIGVGSLVKLTAERADIGYWVGAPFRRLGFAKEIAGALIDFAFAQADVEELVVSHFADNPASERVIKSHGFTFLEFIDQWSEGRGAKTPAAVYLMTRAEAKRLRD